MAPSNLAPNRSSNAHKITDAFTIRKFVTDCPTVLMAAMKRTAVSVSFFSFFTFNKQKRKQLWGWCHAWHGHQSLVYARSEVSIWMLLKKLPSRLVHVHMTPFLRFIHVFLCKAPRHIFFSDECALYQMRCLISRKCINKTQMCDGKEDCDEKPSSDEINCRSKLCWSLTLPLSPTQYTVRCNMTSALNDPQRLMTSTGK